MKKWLWIALIPSFVFAGNGPCQMRRNAVYVDVQPDKVILCDAGVEIPASELSSSGNEFDDFILDMKDKQDFCYPILVLRPGSEKLQHTLRKNIRKHDVDLGIEPWETDRPVSKRQLICNWFQAIGIKAEQVSNVEIESMLEPPSLLATPLEAQTDGKEPVYFECRNNRLFSVSGHNPESSDFHPEGYTFDAPNEESDEMWFGSQLADLNPETQYVAFLVRPDSFQIFRKARQLTWYKELESTCELLDASSSQNMDANEHPHSP